MKSRREIEAEINAILIGLDSDDVDRLLKKSVGLEMKTKLVRWAGAASNFFISPRFFLAVAAAVAAGWALLDWSVPFTNAFILVVYFFVVYLGVQVRLGGSPTRATRVAFLVTALEVFALLSTIFALQAAHKSLPLALVLILGVSMAMLVLADWLVNLIVAALTTLRRQQV